MCHNNTHYIFLILYIIMKPVTGPGSSVKSQVDGRQSTPKQPWPASKKGVSTGQIIHIPEKVGPSAFPVSSKPITEPQPAVVAVEITGNPNARVIDLLGVNARVSQPVLARWVDNTAWYIMESVSYPERAEILGALCDIRDYQGPSNVIVRSLHTVSGQFLYDMGFYVPPMENEVGIHFRLGDVDGAISATPQQQELARRLYSKLREVTAEVAQEKAQIAETTAKALCLQVDPAELSNLQGALFIWLYSEHFLSAPFSRDNPLVSSLYKTFGFHDGMVRVNQEGFFEPGPMFQPHIISIVLDDPANRQAMMTAHQIIKDWENSSFMYKRWKKALLEAETFMKVFFPEFKLV